MTKKDNQLLVRYIANRVKTYRKLAGLTQEELSERAGLGLKYINQLENKGNNLTIQTLQKVIDALEMSPEDFFKFRSDFDTRSEGNSLAMQRLNLKLSQLSDEKADRLLGIFEDILDNL